MLVVSHVSRFPAALRICCAPSSLFPKEETRISLVAAVLNDEAVALAVQPFGVTSSVGTGVSIGLIAFRRWH